MVAAGEDVSAALVFLDDGVGAVATDVVEGVDFLAAVHDDDEVVAGHIVTEEVARLLDSRAVGEEEPLAGEDGSSFELIHLFGRVPCCRQCPDR